MSERIEPAVLPTGRQPTQIDSFVGIRIRRARERRATTVEALAVTVGASQSRIESYEAGLEKITPMMLYRIATTLEVTLGSLFGLDSR